MPNFGLANGLSQSLWGRGLLVLAIFYTMYFARAFLLPVTLALLVALLLSPMVKFLAARGVPRALAAILSLGLFLGAVSGMTYVAFEPASEWLERVPDVVRNITTHAQPIRETLDEVKRTGQEVDQAVSELVEDNASPVIEVRTSNWRSDLAKQAAEVAASAAIVVILVFFLLANGHLLIKKIVGLARKGGQDRKVLTVLLRMEQEMARYLGRITIVNVSIGLVTTLFLWAMGLPEPWLWGMLAALLRFLPYVGVLLATLLILAASVSHFDQLWLIMIPPVGFWLLTAITGLILDPLIHAYRTSINPIVLFVAILFLGWIWGPVGAFMAVPVMALFNVVCKHVDGLQPLAEVLSA